MSKVIDETMKEANEAIRKAAKGGAKVSYKVGKVDMPSVGKLKGVDIPKLTGKEGIEMPKLAGGKGVEMPSIGKLKSGEMPTLDKYMKGVKYADMPSLKGVGKVAGEIPSLGDTIKKLDRKKAKVMAENPIPAAAEMPTVNEEVTL